MKIVQMLPTISYGDAVGNDALALKSLIFSMGFKTEIYAENIDPRIKKSRAALSARPLPMLGKDDILIYHLSTGTPLNDELHYIKCRKIAIYHNITPPDFFKDYSLALYNLCKNGVSQLNRLSYVFDYCLADSDYNREDLRRYGYSCPIDVLPIVIPFKDYEKKPDQKIINKYHDGKTNILFLGRISPNKKQEDVIAAFACYKKYYDPEARLFLVGSCEGVETYQARLEEYIVRLGVTDVYFTGKIPFDEILAYYRIADVFLCMSEHEGFCVPIIEAMYFDVPVIAYASSAVPGTLGGSGILLPEKDPLLSAAVIDKVLADKQLKEDILASQQKRLTDFSYEKISEQFIRYITAFIKEGK